MEERIKFIISIVFFILIFILYILLSQLEKKINEKKKNSKNILIIFVKLLPVFLMFMSILVAFPLNYGGIIQNRYDEFIDWIYTVGSKSIQNKYKQDIISTPEPFTKSPYIPAVLPVPILILKSTPIPEPTMEPTPASTETQTSEPTVEPTEEPTPVPSLAPTSTPMPAVTPVTVNEGQNPSEGANLMTYVNKYRTDAGVAALEWNSDLEQTAKNIAEMSAVGGAPIWLDDSIYVMGRQCNGAKNAQKAVSDWITGNAYISSESEHILNAEYTQMGGALYYSPNGNEYGYHYFWVICLQ